MIQELRDEESVVLTWTLVTNLNLDKAAGLLTSLLTFGNDIKL